MNILLVEDDELTLHALAHPLTKKGHVVHLATNGRQAVDIALDNKIDMVICDLMLPVISGVSFLRIRKKFMPATTPVIAISSLDKGGELLKEMGVEVGFFLQKPFNIEKLSELIEQSCFQDKKEEPGPIFYV